MDVHGCGGHADEEREHDEEVVEAEFRFGEEEFGPETKGGCDAGYYAEDDCDVDEDGGLVSDGDFAVGVCHVERCCSR